MERLEVRGGREGGRRKWEVGGGAEGKRLEVSDEW